jgi:maltose/moltooligosaccharide transporter
VPSVLLPYDVLRDGGGASEIGLITLAAIGIAALIQPIAGTLSDRRGRVPVIAAGVAIAALGLAVLAGGATAIGTVVALAGVAIAQAAYQALMPDRVPAAGRGRASGAKGFFDVGGAFVGFVVVGAALAAGATGIASLVLMTGLAVSLVVGMVLVGSGANASNGVGATPSEPTRLPISLVRLTIARFLFLLGIYAVGRFLLLFSADRLGLSPDAAAAETGAVLAVLALLTAVAALPSGWLGDRVGRRPLMLAGGAVAATGIAGLPLASSLASIVVMGSLMAIGSAAFGAGSWAALADASVGDQSGRRLGLANLGTAGAAAAAGLFGPLIDGADRLVPGTGFALAFGLAAIAVVAGTAVAGLRVPRRRAFAAMAVAD